MTTEPFPWYEIVSGDTLEQGDFLHDCLEPLPPTPEASGPSDADVHSRVIVLTQSCDLEDGGVSLVMVCPVFSAAKFINDAGGKDKRNSRRDALQKGRYTAHLLINQCTLPGHQFEHLITDFGGAFSIPLIYARGLAGTGSRVRMRPPYREHVAQAFGISFMRVGLPLKADPLP